MRKTSFVVTEKDVPPGNHRIGKTTQCGWCVSAIGEEHQPECVKRKRSVVAKMEFEFVTTIPEHWDEEMYEFVYNGNKICASDYFDRLHDECVCGAIKFVREADERDEQLLPKASMWND